MVSQQEACNDWELHPSAIHPSIHPAIQLYIQKKKLRYKKIIVNIVDFIAARLKKKRKMF